MDKIKLIIWDLDETFWKGTLSEEGIIPNQNNIELIKSLSKRGIVNSIVSKNNFDNAKRALVDLGIWEYFVFPKIDWLPKGELVREIISQAHIRTENVLFLDDNHLNLEEVLFYNEGIHIKLPEFILEIREHNAFVGKDDGKLSRLAQYKVLEKKFIQSESFSDNLEFLKFSEIKIRYSQIKNDDLLRIAELAERTNQLNFTKSRDDFLTIKKLLNEDNIKSEKIEVWDKFGDYGVVGFYCLDILKNKLLHFVFSCRTINIGVEQHAYSRLNFPKINVVGDVSGSLSNSNDVDWIEEVDAKVILNNAKNEEKISVLIKGGCDLEQMLHYLKSNNLSIDTEFNTVNNHNIPLHKEHTVFACESLKGDLFKSGAEELSFIPFLSNHFYKTKLFDKDYDVVVYSLLMDYTQVVYSSKVSNIKIAYGGYDGNLINRNTSIKANHSYISDNFINKFSEKFILEGRISLDDFESNLDLILENTSCPVIFINGAEVLPYNNKEKGCLQRHINMNAQLEKVVKKHENAYILDVSKLVANHSELTDNIRHYTRKVYVKMSEELIDIIKNITKKEVNKNEFDYILGGLKHRYINTKRLIKRIIK
jgi:FkbH-like protein